MADEQPEATGAEEHAPSDAPESTAVPEAETVADGDATPAEEPAADQVPEGELVAETAAEEAAAVEETVAAAPEPAPAKPKQRATKPRTPRPSPAARRAAAKAKARLEPAEKAPRQPKPERERGRRQERRGVVVSAAMDKTIVVKVDTIKAHRKYKKVVRRSTKFHAHDDVNRAKVGDVVRIVETRPLSATKRWRLAEVLEEAK
jgi:small subunit ribosomal protein S17